MILRLPTESSRVRCKGLGFNVHLPKHTQEKIAERRIVASIMGNMLSMFETESSGGRATDLRLFLILHLPQQPIETTDNFSLDFLQLRDPRRIFPMVR
ncbi:MAG: hypothetical protein M2R45_05126 [Verrucomicrobia subdivision 3 bacterium]|nr:hypothetical protein [Limisphaerales bacterium]MCS1417188.1 hypothetical protein [Limisphaerales bacterium]